MRCWLVLGGLAACGGNGDWRVDPRIIVDGYHSTETDCRTAICRHNDTTGIWQATLDLSQL